jgi:hypothetical protein
VRRLPVEGEVLVHAGELVSATAEVARAELPGGAESVRAAALLRISPKELARTMSVGVGAQVEEGTLLASSRELLGLIQRQVRSPCCGVLEAISSITGILRLRKAATRVSLFAYLPGAVKEVIPRRGAIIEADVELIQGIFGLGPEHIGPLRWLVDDPNSCASEDAFDESHRDAVIVVGRCASAKLLSRARELRVGAVVAGSAQGQSIVELAGREINPAVTVEEQRPPTVVLTEGFGEMAMGDRVFAQLRRLEGLIVSVSGATQIRAGVLRPEIIAPLGRDDVVATELRQAERVRIVRGDHFGRTGALVSCPAQVMEVGSGVRCLVFEVELETGLRVFVPRPNVERQ